LDEPSEVLAVVATALAFIFSTEDSGYPRMQAVYRYIPPLFLCYFIPGLLGSAGVYGTGPRNVLLPSVGIPILLPAVIALLTAGCDVPAIVKLGPRALGMFATATVGVMLGGPLAVAIVGAFWPDTGGVSIIYSVICNM
jgi:uncharacterized membrane protein